MFFHWVELLCLTANLKLYFERKIPPKRKKSGQILEKVRSQSQNNDWGTGTCMHDYTCAITRRQLLLKPNTGPANMFRFQVTASRSQNQNKGIRHRYLYTWGEKYQKCPKKNKIQAKVWTKDSLPKGQRSQSQNKGVRHGYLHTWGKNESWKLDTGLIQNKEKPWNSNNIKHAHKRQHIREFRTTSEHSPKPGTGPWRWPSVTTYSSVASPVCVCARMRRKEEVRRMFLTGGDEIKSGDFPDDCSLQAAACLSLCRRCHYLIQKKRFIYRVLSPLCAKPRANSFCSLKLPFFHIYSALVCSLAL